MKNSHISTSLIALLFMIASLVFTVVRLGEAPFESSVLKLVYGPDAYAQERFARRLDEQMMFLLSGKDAPQAADELAASLKAGGKFAEVAGGPDPRFVSGYARDLKRWRSAFLDEAARDDIRSGKIADRVRASLYMSLGGAGAAEILQDPLLLGRTAVRRALEDNRSAITMQDGRFVVKTADETWQVVNARLSAHDLSSQDTQTLVSGLLSKIDEVQSAHPGVTVLKRGTLFYGDYARHAAEHDITVLGSVTVAGVVLLMLIAFRTAGALLLTALAIACALLGGITVTLAVFGRVHLIILVLGLSVIGICTDYTVYFLTRRLEAGRRESPFDSVRHLRRELMIALMTSVMAYMMVMLSPFPALRQLAVFCACGLIYSMICVFCFEPWLCGRGGNSGRRALPFSSIMQRYLALRRGIGGISLTAVLVTAAVAGMFFIHSNDDPAAMQRMPAALAAEDARIASLTGIGNDQKWLRLCAADMDALQELTVKARAMLDKAKAQGIIAGAACPPLNTVPRQREDRALIAAGVARLSRDLGIAGLEIPENPYADDEFLTADEYFKSPLSRPYSELLLGDADGYELLISLQGLKDRGALAELLKPTPGITVLDRRQDFTELFRDYRIHAQRAVLLALGLILLLSVLRLGAVRGIVAFVPSLVSLAAALGIPALMGIELNLFTVIALLLVLGIGIDYVLFFSNGSDAPATALFSTTVAMLTTVLSLGILSLSSTAVIRSFGITLCVGIATAWLTAPMAGWMGRNAQRH